MAKLFEETQINGMVLANRFVRSATCSVMAGDDGSATAKLTDSLISLAKGGVGLIISGHAFVQRTGQALPKQLGVYSDELIPSLAAMTEAIHKNNGKIVMQLAHAGLFANAQLTGHPPLAVSAGAGGGAIPGRELTIPEIRQIVEAFAQAAARAKKAGYDGVQLHAAHGYLLSQFLSPAFNRRTDAYGGSLENRARALLDTLQAVRDSVGPDYPVLVKMNGRDFIENGLDLEESLQVAQLLVEQGIDAIEVSGGVINGGKLSPVRVGINCEKDEAYFLQEAKAFREKINVPLMLVGGIRSYQVAERIVTAGTADYVALCRPLLREPGLINRWKSGDRTKAGCLSDNLCFGPAMAGEGLSCVMDH